jgi:hypothetical protein
VASGFSRTALAPPETVVQSVSLRRSEPMLILDLLLAFVVPQDAPPQERKPIPPDSVEIAAVGCLKGRVFTATERPEAENVMRGPDVTGRTFRVNGKKDVMDAIKKYNKGYVELVGIVRTSALADNPPGKRVGNTRVILGAPPLSNDPARIHNEPIGAPVVVMDVSSVRLLSGSCPVQP